MFLNDRRYEDVIHLCQNSLKAENVARTSDKRRCDSFMSKFYENLFSFFMIMDKSKTNLMKLLRSVDKDNIKEASMSTYKQFCREYYDQIENEFVERNKFKSCRSRTIFANIMRHSEDTKAKWINGKTQIVQAIPIK